MIIFLTSSFLPYQVKSEYKPLPMIEDNGFAKRLRQYYKEGLNFLVLASNPDESRDTRIYEENQLLNAFKLSNLPLGNIITFDHSCAKSLDELLTWADWVYLAGGHAPTENKFFKEINLKERLKSFDGVILALSAGAANSANEVYLFPEMPGEPLDKSFNRMASGLGLTNLQIMPHRDFFLNLSIDGLSCVDDILLPDSFGRKVYFISDGSYFVIKNGITEFFGEGEIIQNGIRTPLSPGVIARESLSENNEILSKIIRERYKLVFRIDRRDESVIYELIGNTISEYNLNLGELYDFSLLMHKISETLVVEEEKQTLLDETNMTKISNEVNEQKEFVRTVHFQIGNERKSIGLRISALSEASPYLICSLQDIGDIIDHDWMTDQLARSGFIRYAEELLKDDTYKTGYSLVFSNIKGFKAINAIFGQQSGDMVIFEERDQLHKILQPLLLGRLENEHFALICKNEYLNMDNLMPLSQRTYTQDFMQYSYGIRLGIYPITDEDTSVEQMIDRAKLAEKAMAESDQHFVNYYDAEMRSDYVNQKILLSDMKEGLKSNDFLVYCQPVVDLTTEKIVSAEALVRWNHPRLGFLAPGKFIPIFENAGEIPRLDYYILKEIGKFQKDCISNLGHSVPIAINLSRMDFYDPVFMKSIIEHVTSLSQPISPINVEVTESAYAILEKDALDYLNQMKDHNVKVLLDDYGSGMSSLSTLESFSFDIVKLDMGFVRKIGKSSTAEAIIRSTILLAHALGAKVTAEGTETKEQLNFLKNAGCDYAQGYYYYKPMPLDEFKKLIS